MKLKKNKNGTFTVSSSKELSAAWNEHLSIEQTIAGLMRKHGITDLMVTSTELKKAVTKYQVAKKIDRVDFSDGRYAKLVAGGYDKRFIATDEELESGDFPKGAKSLEAILAKKFADKPNRLKKIWKRIAKTTIDKTALDAVIAEGLLKIEDVEAAYVEKPKAPYVRVYGGGDDDE